MDQEKDEQLLSIIDLCCFMTKYQLYVIVLYLEDPIIIMTLSL
jgi:hypothetical protein